MKRGVEMKKQSRFLFVVVALVAILVSACGGTAAETSAGGDKPRASLVEFTGVIEAIDGNQWTINGQVITVDPAVLRDGPFTIGDTVKVEAEVQVDGSVVVTRVETPVAGVDDDNSNDDDGNGNTNTSLDNSNFNSNDNTNGSVGSNSNDDNSNDDDDSNSNDDNSNDDDDDNSNDDDEDDDEDDDDDSGDDDSGDDSGDDD